jgi:hypothetical protein
MRMRRRTLALAASALVAGGVGWISTRGIDDQLAVMRACEAVDSGDWPAVLAETERAIDDDDTRRAAAQCRCMALLATGDGDACAALLERELAADDGWAPGPALAVHLIQTWRERARSDDAAALARRAALQHPDDPNLFYLELETRSGVEDEAQVLRELASRIPERGPAAVRMRATLANRHLFRGDPVAALSVLGSEPPEGAGDAAGLWYDTRGMALASAGDVAATRALYARWRRDGGDPDELAARYALTLSIAGLDDGERPTVERLRDAFTAGDRVGDPRLAEAVAIRLVLALASSGRSEEALAAYDRAHQRFELVGLSREELQRSGAHRQLARGHADRRVGRLRFQLADPATGAVLWLSPPDDAPVDTPYEAVPFDDSGRAVALRAPGVAPQRWVVRDADGRTLASGTLQPRPADTVRVDVALRPPRPPGRAALSRHPGDGRRRVVLLLLDCGDWRLISYLRQRGELPTLDALLRSGHRAVLDSDPPLTAAALEALVWPDRRGGASLVGQLHRVGVELAGLASVGRNPLSGLSWFLPESDELFATLGAGPHRVANLLLAHGGMHAGRHGEITGPDGQRHQLPLSRSARDLSAAERRDFPGLAGVTTGRDATYVRTIAAELDAARAIVAAGDVDLLALRVEPLDILTHAHFAETVRDGQDDGQNVLYATYRYLDARIAEVHDQLDGDDVLIVMSDHGIRTAMEHSRQAFFVATGAGVPMGRAPGNPDLRGVARVLADLLGVQTAWPGTGVADWAATRRADAPPSVRTR